MPRPGINESDVLFAIETIEADGKTPTVREINRVLGTGSTATISRLMAAIRTKRAGTVKIDARPPEAVLEQAYALTQTLWTACMDLASTENRRLRMKIHEVSYGTEPIADQLDEILGGLRVRMQELHAAADSDLIVMEGCTEEDIEEPQDD